MTEYGFIIDLKKCVGCHGCSVACKQANGTPKGVTRSRVERSYEGAYPDTKRIITPMLCMLCGNPACVEVCPTGASSVTEDGIVVIDKETCIGCKSCMDACPYGARYYIENDEGYYGDLTTYEDAVYAERNMVAGKVDKCDFCIGHSEDGKPDPVCVKACMVEARYFGPLDEVRATVEAEGGMPLKADVDTDPRVYYLPATQA